MSNTALSVKKVAFIGTHSPRKCGIATFTADIASAVARTGVATQVLAINDREEGYDYPEIVQCAIAQNELADYSKAAAYLNRQGLDAVCIQHEFGIYGGEMGSHLLTLLRELDAPIVTTLHTILRSPNLSQCHIVSELALLSERLVVMTEKGREILQDVYGICPTKIAVVPHGIPTVSHARLQHESGHRILTFGLIGPSKGIENMVRALPQIVAEHPDTTYVVAGATHPHIVKHEGERYRESLVKLADELGVGPNLQLIDRFMDLEELTGLLSKASVYVTPYLDKEQITSGTLAYAFGTGNAVVSTPYWHAEELLGADRGVLVPFGDSPALARAISGLLGDPERLQAMRENAYEFGKAMQWPSVAEAYSNIFSEAGRSARVISTLAFPSKPSIATRKLPEISLTHLQAMTDDTGIFQHATYCVPNRHEGYCTDDNARAAILAVDLQSTRHFELAEALQVRFVSFLHHAFNPENGRMRNFMSFDRRWLEAAGSEDSHGRAIWALGTVRARTNMTALARFCGEILDLALPAVESFTSLRAWASTILGLRYSELTGRNASIMMLLSGRIQERFDVAACDDFTWFEENLTYDNARIPQAMIQAGEMLEDEQMIECGLKALKWLVGIQTSEEGFFLPVGSDHFYHKTGVRSLHDQQPLEAAATVDACGLAYRITGQSEWLREMRRAFDWFMGDNTSGQSVCDPLRGAAYDAVTREGVSANQGAESTLAYLSSLLTLQEAELQAAGPKSIIYVS